jgi:hypothetical protein
MKMIVVNIQIVMICKIGRHLCTSLHIEIPDQHIHHNERADKHEDNDKPCVTSSAAHAQQTDRDKTLATKKRHRHKQKLILVPGFNPLNGTVIAWDHFESSPKAGVTKKAYHPPTNIDLENHPCSEDGSLPQCGRVYVWGMLSQSFSIHKLAAFSNIPMIQLTSETS